MANPKTPFPASNDTASLVNTCKSASLRLNDLRITVEAFTVPATTGSGSVADLRTLTATSSTDDVRQVVITLIRDLKEI